MPSQFFKRMELDAHLMKRVEGGLYVCSNSEAMRPILRPDKDSDRGSTASTIRRDSDPD